ncbi:MAG: hypothetical protein KKH67_11970 [candidate division Zixibacteria bacterium]|nr:hypothetical protein [candidate division Zixibacteria bacterium]MBU1472011.1 hypothetical protein [candidate division Zixibacteria bacterium]
MTAERQDKPYLSAEFSALTTRIMRLADQGLLRADFLRQVSAILLDFSGCDAVSIRLVERGRYYGSDKNSTAEESFIYDVSPIDEARLRFADLIADSGGASGFEALCYAILLGKAEGAASGITERGSFLLNETATPAEFSVEYLGSRHKLSVPTANGQVSMVLLPFPLHESGLGLLVLRSTRQDYFSASDIEFFEGIAQMLGMAIVHRRAHVALRERVKELTCLYGIAKLVGRPNISLDEILKSTVKLLKPAWLYPEVTAARIVLDGNSYVTDDFRVGFASLKADMEIRGVPRGFVEVAYLDERPVLDEGPFLREERSLIDAIARELALITERREADEEKSRLQEQLRHADRLATIGQLAAGVAHELNEPLGSILGFAQLAKKGSELSEQVQQDIDRIVAASLHAREVVKKLMLFAREAPMKMNRLNMNRTIEDGLYFLESRCAKAGIEIVKEFDPDIPDITADPSQLYQVLVNLVVNAVQAMPSGGKIIIRTEHDADNAILAIEDTGTGIEREMLSKIFIPFFTTKDVNEGTGLGLAVVHGIVSSHGGKISVESKVGTGTRFEVSFPLSDSTGKNSQGDPKDGES